MSDREPKRRVWISRLMLFVHWLVRVDPEILSGCPAIDRFQAYSKAVLLAAVASIALIAWGGFFLWFAPFYFAVPLTVVVVVWIVVIDQIIGASRWALQGVLAPPKASKIGINAALVLRLVIGVVTASATSISGTMLFSHAKIEAQEEKTRDSENAAKRAAGDADKAQAWQSMLGALDAEVKHAGGEVGALNDRLDAARRLRDAAGQQAVDSKITADCQLTGGPGCKRGAGQQFRAALLRQGKAADDLRRAEGDIPDIEAQIKAANGRRDGAVAAFRAREPEYLEAAQAIDKRVADEAVPKRNDPVMSYMALQQVLNAPDGDGARFFAHLMMALLLTVELSYVIVSEYFSHASIYMARLIARTKILAAQAADEYRHAAGGLFSPKGGRTAFRVVPRFEKSRSDAV